MATGDFLTNAHIVASALYPKADAFAGTMTTDYVCLENYRRVAWLIHTGDATGGTADGVVTVLGATTNTGTNATATTFTYRVCLSSVTVDTWGAQTAALAAGFSMTAGDNYCYWVETTAEEIAAAYTGADFAALLVTEVTNDPIIAGVVCFLLDPRYPGAVPVTAIA
jgi:hypothetical protein